MAKFDLPLGGPSQVVSPYAGASQAARGNATAPTTGTAIATLSGLPAGWYELRVKPGYGGTPDVIDNMQVKIGSAVLSQLIVQAVANGAPVDHVFPRVYVDGSDITVVPVANGGVGTIFRAHITATPVA